MHSIIVIIGPSGCGKSTLIVEVCRRLPELVKPVINLVTRPKREHDPTEDELNTFIDYRELKRLEWTGRAVKPFEYAGHFYSHDPITLREQLRTHHVLWSVAEPAVERLQKAGYSVVPVRLDGIHPNRSRDELRERLDRERSKIVVDYQARLVNDYAPGGLDRTAEKLVAVIRSLSRQ